MSNLSARVRYQSTPDEMIDLENKLARLRENQPLRVVDLFAGCGGMSLGLQRAGYALLGGVEMNPKAMNTHAKNFFNNGNEQTFEQHNTPRNIRDFPPNMFMHEILQADHPENCVDIIVGGPPCQAFSRIGRAKLRHLKQDPDAFLRDERANLYIPYLQYVEFFRPLVVIMENVPDIMNHGGKNVAEEIADMLEEMGYNCRYTILNTAYYGVPQLRQRFYLIAILDALNITPCFPAPTHYIDPPTGYDSAYTAALKMIQQPGLFDQFPARYIEPPLPAEILPPAISTQEALSDLPKITYHLEKQTGKGKTRNFDTLFHYAEEPSTYARNMRTWPGYESHTGVWDHVIRLLPRDYPIFRNMKPGNQYPDAHNVALEIFENKRREQEDQTGIAVVEGSEEYNNLLKQIVPPYDPHKFPNKWWKLIPEQPSRTLTAHMGKDTYSHIHYDSEQSRVISVREAARLQSFPDGFKFTGPMNAAFTQIGNAVSPLQAYAFGLHIKDLLLRFTQQEHEIHTSSVSLSSSAEENESDRQTQFPIEVVV